MNLVKAKADGVVPSTHWSELVVFVNNIDLYRSVMDSRELENAHRIMRSVKFVTLEQFYIVVKS